MWNLETVWNETLNDVNEQFCALLKVEGRKEGQRASVQVGSRNVTSVILNDALLFVSCSVCTMSSE